jgi:hypothetical protein
LDSVFFKIAYDSKIRAIKLLIKTQNRADPQRFISFFTFQLCKIYSYKLLD